MNTSKDVKQNEDSSSALVNKLPKLEETNAELFENIMYLSFRIPLKIDILSEI